jgi:competence protein ComEC
LVNRGDVTRAYMNQNDLCAVYRISVGATKCLLSGDASISAWESILASRTATDSPLAADLLLVPHHGSRNSLDANIASRLLKPAGSVAVLEPNSRYGLPHPEVLQLLEDFNAEVLNPQIHPLQFVLFRDGLYVKRS